MFKDFVVHSVALALLLAGITIFFAVIESDRPVKVSLVYKGHFAILEYDSDHVPHISGTSDEAVYYALGRAQAMDRLWQINLLRRLAAGKLSEVRCFCFVRSPEKKLCSCLVRRRLRLIRQ